MEHNYLQWIVSGVGSLAILFLSGIYQELKGLNKKIDIMNRDMSDHNGRISKIEAKIETLPCKEKPYAKC